jgi:hypothetical protein
MSNQESTKGKIKNKKMSTMKTRLLLTAVLAMTASSLAGQTYYGIANITPDDSLTAAVAAAEAWTAMESPPGGSGTRIPAGAGREETRPRST